MLNLKISPAVYQDYKVRFMSVDLDDDASFIPRDEGIHEVSEKVVRIVRNDAIAQASRVSTKPALVMAYRALVNQCDRLLKVDSAPAAIPPGDVLMDLPISAIKTPPQIRKDFDPDSIQELAMDIQENGLLQPVTVTRCKGSKDYQLLLGGRRLMACKAAGLDQIKAIVRDEMDIETVTLLQLSENIHREDLSLADTARIVRKAFEGLGSCQAVANWCHKSKSWVSKHLALSRPDYGYFARTLIEEGHTEDLELAYIVSQIEKASPAGTNIGWTVFKAVADGRMGRSEARAKLQEILKPPAKKADQEVAKPTTSPASEPAVSHAKQDVEIPEADSRYVKAGPATRLEEWIVQAWSSFAGHDLGLYLLGAITAGLSENLWTHDELESLRIAHLVAVGLGN